eukprot:3992003-Amphidinium_carterae.1
MLCNSSLVTSPTQFPCSVVMVVVETGCHLATHIAFQATKAASAHTWKHEQNTKTSHACDCNPGSETKIVPQRLGTASRFKSCSCQEPPSWDEVKGSGKQNNNNNKAPRGTQCKMTKMAKEQPEF